jgi:hypothetical protein
MIVELVTLSGMHLFSCPVLLVFLLFITGSFKDQPKLLFVTESFDGLCGSFLCFGGLRTGGQIMYARLGHVNR